jgi:hypothetical protein
LFDISASDIANDKASMIFIGGRGTGKTMLLRQFSYSVQRLSLNSAHSYLEKAKKDKYVGVYFRVDNPLLRSLETIAIYANGDKFAENIFTHYFELAVFKEYLEVIRTFLNDLGLTPEDTNYIKIVGELKGLLQLNCSVCDTVKNINNLLSFVVEQINYIWKYQSDKAIDIDDSVKFSPSCGLVLQGRLTNEILRTSIFENLGLDEFNILILIDEFENFSDIQQKVLNTAMRFTNDYGARFRIGMRPNGFKTYATLDDEDFVKEGRDYRKIEFSFPFIKKGKRNPYPELVKMIAKKRLDLVEQVSNWNIVDFLGKEEDLENEATKIAKGKIKHFTEYLKLINKVELHKNLTFEDLSFCRDGNPLFQMECLLLLLRGYEVDFVKKAFDDYKNNIPSEEQKKFSNDYDKKYKLSFVFILCSIYKNEDKKYYGFIDYCQLSSGIIGAFLELCRRAFEKAYFEDRDELFNGHISSDIQTKAAYEYSYAELDMTRRIANHGGSLRLFVDNIGNAFGEIHKDLHIRYPETNLFPVSTNISSDNNNLINIAERWSLIIKKPNLQDSRANGKKQDIYYINRIFAPAFKISYRTRGGLNPIEVNDSYFSKNFNVKAILVEKRQRVHSKSTENNTSNQMPLFAQAEQLSFDIFKETEDKGEIIT